MGRTSTRVRWRAAAAALLAAGIVVGPVAAPAVAEDTIRQQQWHLDAMHASEMWKITKGQGITVAVIDGGFNLEHPDLAGQFLPGKDFSGSPGGVGSYGDGHGTGIASLIAGTGRGMGGAGAQGLAPGVKILPLKINNGSVGSLVSSDFLGQIGEAITYAVDQGARVINISQGMNAVIPLSEEVAKINSVIAAARAKGVLVISSVGNEAEKGNPVEYPGALPGVVGVGASDQAGTVTAESEHGPQVTLVAPGMDMIAACTSPTGYCKSHGTSDSAALVSASAALVWSVHPEWTSNQVLRVIINTAGKPKDGSNRTDDAGYGAARPRIALTSPGDPGPSDVSPVPISEAAPTAAPSGATTLPPSSVPSPVESPTDAAVGVAPTQPKGEVVSRSSSALPIVAAVVAGLALVAGVVFILVRRRRSAVQPEAQVPPVPVQHPMPPVPSSYQPPAPPGDNPYVK
ncbi:S8 family serine peptidase [Kitasatospora sp. NPDC059599]|uniref:S8 family serine peptidase n=1 Tax=Kitasatospora sp. NPDC059599 TaxID=3346880 RepID=UPI0036CDF97D